MGKGGARVQLTYVEVSWHVGYRKVGVCGWGNHVDLHGAFTTAYCTLKPQADNGTKIAYLCHICPNEYSYIHLQYI